MKRITKYLFAALVLPLLASCAAGPDINMTRGMESKGDAFQQALTREYIALAQDEKDEMDMEDAHYFNNKALAAAKGESVGPQPTNERALPGDTKWELEAARQALRTALLSGGTTKSPNNSARAQAMFDCWIQEQEENDQPDHIARCRSAFDEALANVNRRLAERAPEPQKAAPAPAPKPKPKDQEFIVYFSFNSSALNSAAQAVVTQAAGVKAKNYLVTGHTDTAGSSAYNNALATKRANTVAAALVAAGALEDKVVVQAFGEDEPATNTGDNMKESLNRRVTIRLKM